VGEGVLSTSILTLEMFFQFLSGSDSRDLMLFWARNSEVRAGRGRQVR
jgi:hypothetical protein